MTREEIENLVQESTGRRDKVALIRSAIDLAVEEVSSQRLWSDLQVESSVTQSSPTPYIDLAQDLVRLLEVRVIDGTFSGELCLRPKAWVVGMIPSPELVPQRRPQYGYLEGRRLHFAPWPNVAHTYRYTYYRLHPPLTNPTSTVLIRHAGPAVAAYATFWVFQTLEQHQDADRWFSIYSQQLLSALRVDRSNPAVKHIADRRLDPSDTYPSEYWNNPFVRSAP